MGQNLSLWAFLVLRVELGQFRFTRHDTLERDTVLFPQFIRERCNGCGRCKISCEDGGHQAIKLNEKRRPVLNGKKCVGCHLCILVCPQRAIVPGSKRITR